MNDLIERQAAIDAIESHMRSAEEPYYLQDVDRIMNYAFEIAASCIYNLPSAHRTGRWIYYPEINALSCSICKKYVYHYEPYKFCPNCGARMEVEE